MGREQFSILSLKPRSHVRILLYQTWAITRSNTINTGHWADSSSQKYREIIKKTNRRSNNFLKNKLNASQRQEHPLVIIIGRVFKVT